MRIILRTLTLFLFSNLVLLSQPYAIEYDLNISFDCEGTQGVVVGSGSVLEGEEIVFPTLEIPSEYSFLGNLQSVLSVFNGAMLSVPDGCLNENVKFQIYIDLFPCDYENINYRQLLGLTVKVIGENSGEHAPLGYYLFNEGKEIVLKIKTANLVSFLGEDNLGLEHIIAWFVSEGFEADLSGISLLHTLGNEWVNFHLSHFSKLAIGVNDNVTQFESAELTPANFELFQNYPNPFNPTTKITFSLPQNSFVKIKIYNSLGKEIESLFENFAEAGLHEFEFNAENYSTGVYLYSIETNGFTDTKKMILIK